MTGIMGLEDKAYILSFSLVDVEKGLLFLGG